MADLKEVAQQNINAFNAHDANAVAALAHSEVVASAPNPTGRSELRGREAVKEYNQSWFEGFPDAKIMLTNQVIVGNYIVQEGTFDGTNTGTFKTAAVDLPATGRHLRGHYAQVSNLSNGAVVSTRLYFDQVGT